ncbi:MAG: T9SS type A sorting domain-containing protein [Candidatus Marinimicrobia bacterium]|nr:T9SS type A sorting domain-containing protein [Candidatus Neomarinimicrobiota bacterium]
MTGLQPDKDYYYAVKATAGSEKSEFSDTVHVHTETGEVSVAEIPGFFRIDPAYPNPFNPLCVLPLTLDKSSEMRITLYNVNGEKVTSVFQGRMDSGKHHLRIDGNGLSAGIYILRVDSGTRSQAQKLLLIPERRQSAMNESVI